MKKLTTWLTIRLLKFVGRNNLVDKNLLLYTALVVNGANLRAITKQLKESRKPMYAQVDLVLTCGLCPTCKTRANAVVYARNEMDERIDIEWERWEQARARAQRVHDAEMEASLDKWGLL